MIIREAVADYAARAGRLTEAERRQMLATVDTMMRMPASRPQAKVVAELEDIRRARRGGGRQRDR